MNKVQRITLVFPALVALGSMAACSAAPLAASTSSTPTDTTITLIDGLGKEVDVPSSPDRLVLLNSNAGDIVQLCGKASAVAAISDGIAKNRPYLPFVDAQQLDDKASNLSAESILAAKPDLVVAYTYDPDDALVEQLTGAGVPVLRLNMFLPETRERDVREFAKVLECSDRADQYLAWEHEQIKPLEALTSLSPVKGLALSGGALNSGTYRVFPSNVGEGGGLAAAGVENVVDDITWAEGKGGTATQVDGEYIVKRDPKVITLNHSSKDWGGYDQKNADAGQSLIDKAMADPVLSQTAAVKEGNVVVLHTQVMGSDKRFVGQLVVAKMLHPDQLKDVHPQQALDAYFRDWLDVPPGGVWATPMPS